MDDDTIAFGEEDEVAQNKLKYVFRKLIMFVGGN